MRFEPQTIRIHDSKGHVHAIVAKVVFTDERFPVGLAIHPCYLLGPGPLAARRDEYTITHLASGWRVLAEPVIAESLACRWAEYLAPLTDWSRPAEALRADETLRLHIRLARVRASWDEFVEHDLFAPETPVPPPAAAFSQQSLTALIEWISDDMESEAPRPLMQPALDTLLVLHAEVAQAHRGAWETRVL